MIVTIFGFLIVILAANYIAWPMLRGAPPAVAEAAEPSALQKEKNAALEAINEVDWDHRIGKISDKDHTELRRTLEDRALVAMAQLEESPAPAQESANFCPGCGATREDGASFCADCGRPFPEATVRDGPTS